MAHRETWPLRSEKGRQRVHSLSIICPLEIVEKIENGKTDLMTRIKRITREKVFKVKAGKVWP